MESKIVNVTPEMARQWISTMGKNRPLSKDTVKKYAADMKSGKWQLIPDGISFNEKGELVNGNHRLHGVIQANVTVPFYVTTGVPVDAVEFDRNNSRGAHHVLRFRGIESNAASTLGVGMVNFLFAMASSKHHFKPSDGALYQFVSKNEELMCDAIRISIAGGQRKKPAKASPVVAAIFSALYCGINPYRLASMFEIVNTGFATSSTDSAAVLLRNHLLSPEYNSTNSLCRERTFIIATQAINDYCSNTPRHRVYKSDAEALYFPKVLENEIKPLMK